MNIEAIHLKIRWISGCFISHVFTIKVHRHTDRVERDWVFERVITLPSDQKPAAGRVLRR